MSSRTYGSCRATQSSFANALALAVALLVMTAEGSAAQTVTSGGLFGATRNDAGGRERLNLQLTMAGAFDSDVPPEFQSVAGRNDLLVGNRSALVAGSTRFERNRHSVQLFGSAATTFRYVQQLDQIAMGSQQGRLGLTFRLPRQGNLEVTQAGAYSPSYFYDLLPAVIPQPPGEAVPGNPQYQIDQTESMIYTTKTALTFGSARGTRLTTTAEYGYINYKNRTIGLPDRATYTVVTRLSKAVSRKLVVSAGYDYEAGEVGVDALAVTHRVTMGVEYSPPLSLTRRLTFRLELSPSVFQVPESALPSVADGKVYPMQGEASVEYPFHLKWRVHAGFRRSVDYVSGMNEPVLADGARVGLIGLVSRRVDVSALAGYANAVSVITRETRNYSTYVGEVRLRYALARSLAVYSEYVYYNYNLAEQARAAGVPAAYQQHGIRAGVMIFSQPLK